MDNLFNNTLSFTSSNITFCGMLLTFFVAIVFGFVIGTTYMITQKRQGYQRNFVLTLIMLPVILSMIIIFVGSNIARAFSLAGTIAVIRYRSAPGDPKDIGYVFFAVASGLACGVGLFGYAAIFVLLLCLILILVEKFNFAVPSKKVKILKITVTEDMNYSNIFDDVLNKYTENYELIKIKTTDLGSLFEVVYQITTKDTTDDSELINDLRCINGNLTIVLSVSSIIGSNL